MKFSHREICVFRKYDDEIYTNFTNVKF